MSSSAYTGFNELVDNERLLKSYNQSIAKLLIGKFADDKATLQTGARLKILDYGAGIGTLSNIIHKLLPNAEIICVEPDTTLHQYIMPSFLTYSSISDCEHLLADIDLIFTSNVLEHIKHDSETLKNLRLFLKQTGQLAIYVPAMPRLWTKMDSHVGHYRRYTKKTLLDSIHKAELTCCSISYIDSAGMIATMAYKALNMILSKSYEYQRPSKLMLKVYDKFIWPLSTIGDFIFRNYAGKNLIARCSN